MDSFERIVETFEFFEDWEGRYHYLTEIGQRLPAFPEACKVLENQVQGCVSSVPLARTGQPDRGRGGSPGRPGSNRLRSRSRLRSPVARSGPRGLRTLPAESWPSKAKASDKTGTLICKLSFPGQA